MGHLTVLTNTYFGSGTTGDFVAFDAVTGLPVGGYEWLNKMPAMKQADYIQTTCVSRDGKKYVAAAGATTLLFADITTGTVVQRTVDDWNRLAIRMSADGSKAVVYGIIEGTGGTVGVQLYDMATFTAVGTQITAPYALYGPPALNHDGSRLAMSDTAGGIAVYNTSTMTPVTLGDALSSEWPEVIQFSPDGSKCVVGGYNAMHVYETTGWTKTTPAIQPFEALTKGRSNFSPDGATFVCRGGRYLNVYDTTTWTLRCPQIDLWAPELPWYSDRGQWANSDGVFILFNNEGGSGPGNQYVARFDTATGALVSKTDVPGSYSDPVASLDGGITSQPFKVTTGTTGVVLSSTNTPAAGVGVRVYNRANGELISTATTDASGKFTALSVITPAEVDVVLIDASTPALNDLIYRVTP